jgi:hypothetical protein
VIWTDGYPQPTSDNSPYSLVTRSSKAEVGTSLFQSVGAVKLPLVIYLNQLCTAGHTSRPCGDQEAMHSMAAPRWLILQTRIGTGPLVQHLHFVNRAESGWKRFLSLVAPKSMYGVRMRDETRGDECRQPGHQAQRQSGCYEGNDARTICAQQ